MGESGMGEDAENRELEAVIDQAAKRLVLREPSPRLYAAVMADIRATSTSTSSEARRPTSSPWTMWRWALVGVSAAVFFAVTALLWHALRPTTLPQVQVARVAPPATEAGPTVVPPSPSRSTPSPASPASPARRPVPRTYVEHQPIAEATAAAAAVPPEIDVKDIHIVTIPVAMIPVTTIAVPDIADDGLIPIGEIEADGK